MYREIKETKELNRLVYVSLEELIHNDLNSFFNLLNELLMAEYSEEERGYMHITNIDYKPFDGQIIDGMVPISVTSKLLIFSTEMTNCMYY